MNRVAVVYWSGTGNTESMAKAVAEGAQKAGVPEVALLTVGEAVPGIVGTVDAVALELQARLMGRLGPNTAVQVNVDARSLTTAPEWPILMRVLSRHPEIYQELTAELMEAGF